MGIINIELFATLDLVGQSPGGPDEDPVGFPFGGLQGAGSTGEKLVDRLDLWVYPVVLGVGKKVFDGGAVPTSRSSNRQQPVPRAPCTCATASPMAPRDRGQEHT